jgi:hypothetical protein
MNKITPQTKLFDLVEVHPEIREVLAEHRIRWLEMTCSEQADRTLAEAAAQCDFDVAEMVDELNQVLRQV